MQIFKRVAKNAQNMIEFVFVFPLLIFIVLVIMEVAFFWQDVNAIYNLNAEINANVANLKYTGMAEGSTCVAATEALRILEARAPIISLTKSSYKLIKEEGNEPFMLYHYYGGPSLKENNGGSVPQIQMWVDCRSPFEDGVTTQVEFYHKNMILKATIPRFDSNEGIVVIPDKIFIASPKLNTIRHY